MMKWLKKLFKEVFKSKVKLIEEPKQINIDNDKKSNFIMQLKQQADPEQDDGSGYKIIRILRIEDMI